MKLERISENQIRCTLNKADMAEKDLRLNELAYGTDKAKALFREMMQQASVELGFEVDDIPLMIEAIPVSSDCLILNITKVDDPDELDARFSRFSKPADDIDLDNDDDDDDILEGADNLDSIMSIIGNIVSDIERVSSGKGSSPVIDKNQFTEVPALSEKESKPGKKPAIDPKNIYRIYQFRSMEDIITASNRIQHVYNGKNTLYKDPRSQQYYLIVFQPNDDQDTYNRICLTLSEYGTKQKTAYARKNYMQEHYQIIIKDHAIATLSSL